MIDTDSWQEILHTLGRNKLRTFMTACGVFWGIFMLICMLGSGNGLEFGINQNMFGLQKNSVYVWGQRASMPYKGLKPGREIDFDNGDIPALQRIYGMEHLAPRVQLGGWRDGNNVVRENKTGNFTVMGDYPQIQFIEPLQFQDGRFLNELDIRDRRKVCVIGKQVVDVLFSPGEEPVGSYVKIKGVYFQVIGTFKSLQTGEQGERLEQTIFIPFTTFQQAFNVRNKIGWFAMTARADASAKTMEREVKRILAERHLVHPDDDVAIGSFNVAEEFEKTQWLFVGIKAFVWFVGLMTLLAGILGVSNIMLIVVKERTKEIGIRRALGATPRQVVRMVMQESVFLTTIAGYAGLCAGVGVLELLRRQVGDSVDFFANPSVDFKIAMTATLILVVAGAVAGIIPARHVPQPSARWLR